MVSLWFPYGFPMVSLWFPYGFPMGFPVRYVSHNQMAPQVGTDVLGMKTTAKREGDESLGLEGLETKRAPRGLEIYGIYGCEW